MSEAPGKEKDMFALIALVFDIDWTWWSDGGITASDNWEDRK
ncbi:MAG: hypothetical protein ABSG00_05700 [Terracidiphilus sp.]|jgi:hypothetical protein